MLKSLPASIMGAGSLCCQKPEKRPTSILCSILFGNKRNRQKEEKPENAVFSGLFNGADGRIRTGDLILTKDALYLLSYISTLCYRRTQDLLYNKGKQNAIAFFEYPKLYAINDIGTENMFSCPMPLERIHGHNHDHRLSRWFD